MPRTLYGHGLVTLGKDLLAIGGYSPYSDNVQSSLYRMSCQNKDCLWYTLSQELKVGRKNFVTMIIPDVLTDCGKKFQLKHFFNQKIRVLPCTCKLEELSVLVWISFYTVNTNIICLVYEKVRYACSLSMF